MRRIPGAKRVVVMVAVCVVAAACGVPDSGDFIAIPENEFPAAISETRPSTTTTTTSTTTTTTSTTLPATTTVTSLPGPTTTLARTTTSTSTTSTSTTTTVPTEEVQLYYVQGSRVRAVTVNERSPVTVQRKLVDLTDRVSMISGGRRLATVLPEGVSLGASQTRGVVTVELGISLAKVVQEDYPLFFAQIVLTALAPSQLGQVVFTERGVPYPAVKGDGTVLDPGAPAAWEDYEELITDDIDTLPTTTTPRTTTTTTTIFN